MKSQHSEIIVLIAIKLFPPNQSSERMAVTSGQIYYEHTHLNAKLKIRDPTKYEKIKDTAQPEPHSLFFVIKGDIESWERI